MKYKMSIAITLTVLLIAGGIAETVYVGKTFDYFESRLTELKNCGECELETAENLLKEWEKKSEILGITIPHVQLMEITVTYGEWTGALAAADADSADALLSRILLYTAQMSKLYGFGEMNVL